MRKGRIIAANFINALTLSRYHTLTFSSVHVFITSYFPHSTFHKPFLIPHSSFGLPLSTPQISHMRR